MKESKAIIIVEAEAENIPAIAPLFNAYRVFYEQESDLFASQEYLNKRFHDEDCIVFIARSTIEAASPIVGFAILYPVFSSVSIEKNWHLGDLYVSKEYRKKGIGEQLIAKVKTYAAHQGATFLSLNTAENNDKAKRLYHKAGFKPEIPLAGFDHYRWPTDS